MGISIQGVSVQGVSLQGGLCPSGVSVQGGLCQGDPPLDRDPLLHGNEWAVRILLECILVPYPFVCLTGQYGMNLHRKAA